MRLVDKYQFYCNSADRINQASSTGDFAINIRQEFTDEPNKYLKLYLQSAVIRYDAPPINATNNAVEVDKGAGYVTYFIPVGGPSVLDLATWFSNTADNGPGCPVSYNKATGKFVFTRGAFDYTLRFAAANSACVAFGFPSGSATYAVTAGSPVVSTIVASVNAVKAINVACTFGDERFTTANSNWGSTNVCASMPILGPWLSNVAYADPLGTNGSLMRAARQQLSTLNVQLTLDTRIAVPGTALTQPTPFVPVTDWPFVISCEVWLDETDVTNGLMREILDVDKEIRHVLQIQAIGDSFGKGTGKAGLLTRKLLEDADLNLPIPPPFQGLPETNAEEDMLPLPNDPNRYPHPPPDLGGLIPSEYVHLLSLNDPETEDRQLKRARGD